MCTRINGLFLILYLYWVARYNGQRIRCAADPASASGGDTARNGVGSDARRPAFKMARQNQTWRTCEPVLYGAYGFVLFFA